MGYGADFLNFVMRRTGKSSGEVLDALRTFFPKGAPTRAVVKNAAPPAPVLPAPRPSVQPVSRPVVETRQLDLMDASAEQTKRGELRYRGKYQADRDQVS